MDERLVHGVLQRSEGAYQAHLPFCHRHPYHSQVGRYEAYCTEATDDPALREQSDEPRSHDSQECLRHPEQDYLSKNPASAVHSLPRIEPQKVSFLAGEELLRFLEIIRGNPYEIVFRLAVFTGMREGELIG